MSNDFGQKGCRAVANVTVSNPRSPEQQSLAAFFNTIEREIEMKILLLTLLTVIVFSSSAMAGRCDHSWQTAKDGSRCGDRAADIRPGGR